MFIHKLVVGYETNELTEQAFQMVITEVWLGARYEGGQEMYRFYTDVLRFIQIKEWFEQEPPQFILVGDDRYVFRHFNGSSIEYYGGKISIEFSPTGPTTLGQKTCKTLQQVEELRPPTEAERYRAGF